MAMKTVIRVRIRITKLQAISKRGYGWVINVRVIVIGYVFAEFG